MKRDWYESWSEELAKNPVHMPMEFFTGTHCDVFNRVLVIEDDRDLSQALAFRLRGAGYEVCTAEDGVSGMERIRSDAPDVLLLDLGLPRMHGFKLLHALRIDPETSSVPVVVLTGSPDPDLDEKLSGWDVKSVLRKPASHRQILRAVRNELAD